ncbi:hypothetical protein [Streptomyces sp. NPDC007940]|uniref:hypothetical protein n=1 Tax=Streptomyces sp. NPDC007940 TaxID=3364796 RepID=UPI0036E049A2
MGFRPVGGRETKHARHVAEWQELVRSSPLTRHMELVAHTPAEAGGRSATPSCHAGTDHDVTRE